MELIMSSHGWCHEKKLCGGKKIGEKMRAEMKEKNRFSILIKNIAN